jgi:hypothetical protein
MTLGATPFLVRLSRRSGRAKAGITVASTAEPFQRRRMWRGRARMLSSRISLMNQVRRSERSSHSSALIMAMRFAISAAKSLSFSRRFFGAADGSISAMRPWKRVRTLR